MRYTIIFENLDSSAVNSLGNAISSRPWMEADPLMRALMKQVQEQEHAAAVTKATTPAKAADAPAVADA